MKFIVQEAKQERQREVNRLFLEALQGAASCEFPRAIFVEGTSFSCTFLTLPVH